MKKCAQCHRKLGLGVRFRNMWNGHWWVHVRFCSARCEAIYEAKRNDAVKHRWHVRRDDVAQFLINVIEVDQNFKNHLASHKLTQKYWANHFADLIIDRTWSEITNEGGAA